MFIFSRFILLSIILFYIESLVSLSVCVVLPFCVSCLVDQLPCPVCLYLCQLFCGFSVFFLVGFCICLFVLYLFGFWGCFSASNTAHFLGGLVSFLCLLLGPHWTQNMGMTWTDNCSQTTVETSDEYLTIQSFAQLRQTHKFFIFFSDLFPHLECMKWQMVIERWQ